ncbi:MAG: ATP-dependent metallopeptidase FtsH/Yme1/Tma family protein, partial [Eubacterium sp.]|nr:ATP-dependent metallopeptidase FtsH/Yme1/Tma family protein [Eubacterium sp.]
MANNNTPSGRNDRGQGDNGQNDNNRRSNGQMFMMMLFMALVVLFFFSLITSRTTGSAEEISYSQFLEMVENGEVASVKIKSYQIDITPKGEEDETDSESSIASTSSTAKYYTAIVADEELVQTLRDNGVEINGTIPDTTSAIMYNILSIVLPILMLWGLLFYFMRRTGGGGGIMGVGKSNAKVYMEKETGVT